MKCRNLALSILAAVSLTTGANVAMAGEYEHKCYVKDVDKDKTYYAGQGNHEIDGPRQGAYTEVTTIEIDYYNCKDKEFEKSKFYTGSGSR